MSLKSGERDPNAIPKRDLEHGAYYSGYCRNANIARWDGEKEQFVFYRHKFSFVYLEAACCQEDEEHYDVFVPLKKLDSVDPRDEIDLSDPVILWFPKTNAKKKPGQNPEEDKS